MAVTTLIQEPTINAAQFSIMRHAVTLAKEEHFRHVGPLRIRLQTIYDNQDQDIDTALQFWAEHASQT